ncbi:hypothetical protein ACM26V_24635 [Salipaludibacillus sp. HK11]|uniref:hypothetical protein n=1 Tax=Salipaludibacillus sp. HK11 TaxID=3394320 RepID=UPI0039FD849D
MRPTLLSRIGSAPKPKFEYVVRAETEGGYFKQCGFGSEVQLSDEEAIYQAKRILGECYGSKWKVEEL